jgi:hypothetical protein
LALVLVGLNRLALVLGLVRGRVTALRLVL